MKSKIKNVVALSKTNFIEYVLENNIHRLDDVACISILDPVSTPRFVDDSDKFKTFWIYDVEQNIGNIKKLNVVDALEIVSFINKNKDKTHFFVHCSAGVSRSGAVAQFIFDYFVEDKTPLMKEKFKDKNQQIIPNLHIKKTLLKVYEAHFTSDEDYI